VTWTPWQRRSLRSAPPPTPPGELVAYRWPGTILTIEAVRTCHVGAADQREPGRRLSLKRAGPPPTARSTPHAGSYRVAVLPARRARRLCLARRVERAWCDLTGGSRGWNSTGRTRVPPPVGALVSPGPDHCLHGIPSGWSHDVPFAVRRPAHRPRHALASTSSRGRCHILTRPSAC
jgi:hypothetical protein